MAHDPRLIEFARRMRREPTPCEEILWRELRGRKLIGFKFRRQHPLGHYIADFYSSHATLVIELDGDTHATPEAEQYDRDRHAYIRGLGVEVVRFWNAENHENLEGTLDAILRKCVARLGSRRKPLPRVDRRPRVMEQPPR